MNPPAADPALLQWHLAHQAVDLLVSDPDGLHGMLIRGRHGPARDHLLAILERRFKVVRVPINVSEERLCGGLDINATLAAGRPVHEAGLLDDPSRLLLFCGAERLPARVLGLLSAALDDAPPGNATNPEPDTTTARLPSIVLLDESLDDEPGLVQTALADRLALHVTVPDLSLNRLEPASRSLAVGACADGACAGGDPIARAQIDANEHLPSLTALAAELGIASLRVAQLCLRVARCTAALAGNNAVDQAAATAAVQLVLAPRARCLPQDMAEPSEAPEKSEESEIDTAAGDSPTDPTEPPADRKPTADDPGEPPDPTTDNDPLSEALPDTLVNAAAAAMPAHLLASLTRTHVARSRHAGRDAESRSQASSGRPTGVSRPRGRRPERRLNLLETLKAATPKQRLRGRVPGDARPPAIRSDDFRLTRYRQPSRTTTVFVVDASGSAAQHRLAEAKGAVELLLADCYVRRDRVALVTFRGHGATLDLSPTRSLTRAKRCLASLPGGGGTPLAAGFNLAADLLIQLHKAGEVPVGVFMTDGKANIALDGEPSRPQAMQDAEDAAQRLRTLSARLLMIDTGPRPRASTARLAELMQAKYLPLPLANATGMPALVAEVQG